MKKIFFSDRWEKVLNSALFLANFDVQRKKTFLLFLFNVLSFTSRPAIMRIPWLFYRSVCVALILSFLAFADVDICEGEVLQRHDTTANGASSLTVIVPNVPTNEGEVRAALYNSPQEFPRGKVYRSVQGIVKNGGATLKFENLPNGEYAIAIMHDRNGNKKMDYNALGIPIEGFGFSNNARAIFSAPSFHEAKFTLPPGAQKTIIIRLQ